MVYYSSYSEGNFVEPVSLGRIAKDIRLSELLVYLFWVLVLLLIKHLSI